MISFGKAQKRLIVEINMNWLKWAVVKSPGARAVLDIGVLPLTTSGDVLTQGITEIVKKHKIESQDVIGCLPRYQLTVRNVELPSTDPAEIRNMFEIQATKQTPYAADQIISGYYLIHSSHEGYSSIMLVVAHRQVVTEHLRILQEAGLKSQQISVSTFDSASWIAKQMGLEGRRMDDRAAAILDVDADTTDFFVYGKGCVLFTQNLSVGFEKLTQAPEEWREKFLGEISRFFEIFKSEEMVKDLTDFVLTGASGALLALRPQLQAIIGLEPREVAYPAAVQKILDQNEEVREPAKKISFTSLMGLASQEKPSVMNLVPQEVIIQSTFVERGRDILVMGVLALSLALAGIGFFVAKYYERQRYFEWLDQKFAKTHDEADKVESTRALLKDITRLNKKSAAFFKNLIHLHNVLPREIYITELMLTQDRHLELRGRAERMTSVFDLANSLKSKPSFRDVETKQLTKRMADNKEVVDFEINCRLSEE